MSDIRAHLVVRGLVQGVGFRYWAAQWAGHLGLAGWVCNAADGSVETEIEGDRSVVEEYITQMKIGPRAAHVSDVSVEYQPYQGNYKDFNITR
jgi:acylphosphatase